MKKGVYFSYIQKNKKEYLLFAYNRGYHFYTNFGHLYSFSAAYYPYMWVEVIAADILKKFDKQGMRNSQFAERYRQSILTLGGSKDASQLIEDFLLRPFKFDAFIDRLNGAS